ncbi:hypothetical protein MATL_G00115020 [Megalops atlanticus]|uniref:LRRNT domain-containing protein n=1 Tax=Megalops atlanticus TaxID=7932 RepID=A0A9D3TCG4_MEGAT|nr:hypothetical protein MATL_G00115020 [Megalops atlanticus]
MRRMRRAQTMPPCAQLACALLLPPLLFGGGVLAICPPMCSCARGHRAVDCSARGLSLLPDGLQHNIGSLNLSRNRLQDLDGLLSHSGHLRTLDVSHNRLSQLPADLPRALWDVRAAGNRLRQLEKNHTAYQWNLRTLDLSANELERVVFINNTLPALRSLNLSHNRFWTVPTNMPHNLETVDLSHNFLVQILPGSLDRLPRLARFYLHGNRFAAVGGRAFSRLPGLRLLTLYGNPWACEDEERIAALLAWARSTPARVEGCPCHTRPICGGAWPTPTSYDADARDAREASQPPMQAVTSAYPSELGRGTLDDPQTALPSTPAPRTPSTPASTTERPRRSGKPGSGAGVGTGVGVGGARSATAGLTALTPAALALNLLLTVTGLAPI